MFHDSLCIHGEAPLPVLFPLSRRPVFETSQEPVRRATTSVPICSLSFLAKYTCIFLIIIQGNLTKHKLLFRFAIRDGAGREEGVKENNNFIKRCGCHVTLSWIYYIIISPWKLISHPLVNLKLYQF